MLDLELLKPPTPASPAATTRTSSATSPLPRPRRSSRRAGSSRWPMASAARNVAKSPRVSPSKPCSPASARFPKASCTSRCCPRLVQEANQAVFDAGQRPPRTSDPSLRRSRRQHHSQRRAHGQHPRSLRPALRLGRRLPRRRFALLPLSQRPPRLAHPRPHHGRRAGPHGPHLQSRRRRARQPAHAHAQPRPRDVRRRRHHHRQHSARRCAAALLRRPARIRARPSHPVDAELRASISSRPPPNSSPPPTMLEATTTSACN